LPETTFNITIKQFDSKKRPASTIVLQGVHYFCVSSLPNIFSPSFSNLYIPGLPRLLSLLSNNSWDCAPHDTIRVNNETTLKEKS
jgi:peroxiredoxin